MTHRPGLQRQSNRRTRPLGCGQTATARVGLPQHGKRAWQRCGRQRATRLPHRFIPTAVHPARIEKSSLPRPAGLPARPGALPILSGQFGTRPAQNAASHARRSPANSLSNRKLSLAECDLLTAQLAAVRSNRSRAFMRIEFLSKNYRQSISPANSAESSSPGAKFAGQLQKIAK